MLVGICLYTYLSTDEQHVMQMDQTESVQQLVF